MLQDLPSMASPFLLSLHNKHYVILFVLIDENGC